MAGLGKDHFRTEAEGANCREALSGREHLSSQRKLNWVWRTKPSGPRSQKVQCVEMSVSVIRMACIHLLVTGTLAKEAKMELGTQVH